MHNVEHYRRRREALAQRYLAPAGVENVPAAVGTAGVHHLVLIVSDMEATIRFYTEVLQMRLVKVIENRDDPTSTHVFLDMGGGNMLAFFDFPEHGDAAAVRGVGAMHHVALKASAEQYRAVIAALEARGLAHDAHGSPDSGSVYLRDPDNILLEVTTGR